MVLSIRGKIIRFLSLVVFWALFGIITVSAQQNSAVSGMRAVHDPLSKKQPTLKDVAQMSNGYWRSGKNGRDSLVLEEINFRVNSSLLERDFMDNARALDQIISTFSDPSLLADMDFITITAAASPEGNTAANEKLAADRALSTKYYIMRKFPDMDRDRIYTFSIGEDWPGLRRMVDEDLTTPYRSELLKIIDSSVGSPTKWTKIKSLGDGAAYRYLAAHMLPSLRGAAAFMIYYKDNSTHTIQTITQTDTITLTNTITRIDTIYIDRLVESIIEVPVETECLPEKTPYYFAIKTNLLYDLALLPDLALEFSLGRRWSIEVDAQWAWWNTPTDHKNCWRIQTVGLETRKWLGSSERTPLTGHYLGLYGMAGTYDIRFNNKTGYLSDMSYSAGLSYGYSMPVGRRWNLELGFAVGYLGGKYKTYGIYNETYDVFPKIADKKMHYVGPTKAKIALVWLLGSGKNETKRK